jgi:hypothetical protein
MKNPSAAVKTDITRKVLIVVCVIILILIGWYAWASQVRNDRQPAAQQATETFTTFSGTVTARNNGCAHDDICTVTVDGRTIVTGGGLTADPNANTYGVMDNDLRIGDKVSVKARSTDHGLTLQGCQDCYITRGTLQR